MLTLPGIRMSKQSVSSVGTDLPSRLQQPACNIFLDRVDQHFDRCCYSDHAITRIRTFEITEEEKV